MPVLAADVSIPAITICQPHKPDGAREYWQWRFIDGKMCWFPGRRHREKSELRWQPSPRPSEGKGEKSVSHSPQSKNGFPPDPIEPEPPKIVEGSFEDRWKGLDECRAKEFVWDCRPLRE